MAPSFCGDHSADHARLMQLSELALSFALKVLKPGGSFVCKISQGVDERPFQTKVEQQFRYVKRVKPEASRKASSELYLVAVGLKANKEPL